MKKNQKNQKNQKSLKAKYKRLSNLSLGSVDDGNREIVAYKGIKYSLMRQVEIQ